jgi:hypothetical protein
MPVGETNNTRAFSPPVRFERRERTNETQCKPEPTRSNTQNIPREGERRAVRTVVNGGERPAAFADVSAKENEGSKRMSAWHTKKRVRPTRTTTETTEVNTPEELDAVFHVLLDLIEQQQQSIH